MNLDFIESKAPPDRLAASVLHQGVQPGSTHRLTSDHAAPFQRFRSLPLSDLITGLDVIFDFHRFAAELGWVAVDFYDGAMIYDFSTKDLRLIDLDNYRDRPFTNEMGRMFGSTRFMAPEEFGLGAIKASPSAIYFRLTCASIVKG